MKDYSNLFRKPGCANWFIRFRANGQKIVKSTGTPDEREARKFLKKEMAEASYLGAEYIGPKEKSLGFKECAELIRRDYRINNRRSATALGNSLAHLEPFFSRFAAADVTLAVIEEYRDRRMSEVRMVGPKDNRVDRPYSAASINREMAALKRMFKLAVAKGLLSKMPGFPAALAEDNAREGFVDQVDLLGLLALMPEDLRDPIAFLYLSAWRRGEMLSLKWADVDLSSRMITLRPANSKNRTARQLPLDDPELLALILRAKARRRLDCLFVFHRDGRQLKPSMLRKCWKSAAKAIAQPGLVIHDLRRSGIRELIRAGVSQSVAMKLSGQKTDSVFRRYNITDERDLRAAVKARRAFLDAQPVERKVVPIAAARGAQMELGAGAGDSNGAHDGAQTEAQTG